jgi:hypothetical protein
LKDKKMNHIESHHNVPELAGMTAEEREIVDRGAASIESLKRTFDHWMVIGNGLKIIHDRATALKGRNTFQQLAEQCGYGGLFRSANGKTNQSVVTHLLQIVERESEVRQWRENLTADQRWAWASPSSIKARCPIFAKAHKKPRRDKQPQFEVAIDIVHDHLEKTVDDDNRRALIERIVQPFFNDFREVWAAAMRLLPIEDRIATVRQMIASLELNIDQITENTEVRSGFAQVYMLKLLSERRRLVSLIKLRASPSRFQTTSAKCGQLCCGGCQLQIASQAFDR